MSYCSHSCCAPQLRYAAISSAASASSVSDRASRISTAASISRVFYASRAHATSVSQGRSRPKAPSRSWYSVKRRSTMSMELCQYEGHADLAIGIPGEHCESVNGAGAVEVIYSRSKGLVSTFDDLLNQIRVDSGDDS